MRPTLEERFWSKVNKNGPCWLWTAGISAYGKFHHLGVFPTPEEAHEAYCEAARRLHGKFWNSGELPLVEEII